MSRFILVSDDSDFARRARLAVSGLNGSMQVLPSTAVAEGPDEVLRHAHGEPVELLLLGPGLSPDAALQLATIFDLRYPDIIVVLVAGSEAELAVKAMRAGVRDLLSPQADAESIRLLLERATLASVGRKRGSSVSEDADGGQVIAVMSPKGGVGKTTVATNLAIGLAKQSPMGVVIVDLDLQFGDVASGLALEPEHSLTDAVYGAASQDSMVLKAFLTVHPSGVYALCAPVSPADANHISGEQIARLLSQLAAQFRYVIVDTSPGLGEHCLATIEQATDVVWVCGMDIPSIRGLHTSLDLLAELHLLPSGRHVVLNFADRRTGLSVQDIEAAIGIPVDVVLPHSRTVPFATNQGVPLLQSGKRDAVTRGLRRLVDRFDPAWGTRPRKKVHRREVVS